MISTHALTWSATIQKTLAVGLASDFNSRTHVECDRLILNVNHVAKISTHALTWSATVPMGTDVFSVQISTHALTWSATALQMQLTRYGTFQLTHSRGVRLDLLSYIPAAGKNFNSRTHVECDFLPYRFVCVSLWISTHALTWSATDFARFAAQPEKFQLTHSRGVRPLAAGFAYLYQNFNSRTHVECDGAPYSAPMRIYQFQLTHSRGVRRRT